MWHRLVYVSGPYRSPIGPYGIKENIEAAERVAVALWKLGFAVICPHKNTAFLDGAVPDYAWLMGDLVMVERSDMVVMVEGWQDSMGSLEERDHAISCDIPVYEWPKDRSKLKALIAEEGKVLR